jgi:hypothetical protein
MRTPGQRRPWFQVAALVKLSGPVRVGDEPDGVAEDQTSKPMQSANVGWVETAGSGLGNEPLWRIAGLGSAVSLFFRRAALNAVCSSLQAIAAWPKGQVLTRDSRRPSIQGIAGNRAAVLPVVLGKPRLEGGDTESGCTVLYSLCRDDNQVLAFRVVAC